MKISIITITYNSEKTLSETVKSIRKQKTSSLEYIIIDGGSTDGTLNIIKSNSDVITKWISEPDQGISDAFNKGIKLATGEVIGFINSDDKLADGALKVIEEQFSKETEVLFGNVVMWSEQIGCYVNKSNPDLEELHNCMSIMHPATFIRKAAYEKYGLYDVCLRCVMDRELLLRFLTQGAKFKYVDQELAWFHLDGMSGKNVYKYTIPENQKISVDYGQNPILAKCVSMKLYLNHAISNLLRKRKTLDKIVRKILRKERIWI